MNEVTPDETPAGASAAPSPPAASRDRAWSFAALALAVLALLFLGWLWLDSHRQVDALRQEVAKKLSDADTLNKASRVIADQSREASTEAQVKLGVLESRVAESQSQQIALEALYQELSRNRDEWAFAEIEQSLLIECVEECPPHFHQHSFAFPLHEPSPAGARRRISFRQISPASTAAKHA